MKTWLKVLVAVPALCLTTLPMLAQPQDASQQQTGDALADAARKARDKKKTAAKPKKVYTEEDISRNHPDSASQSASSAGQAPADAAAANAQGAGAAIAPADDNKDAKKDDETSWRKRFKEMHTKISDAEKELDILQRESEKTQLQYYPDPQKALTEQNSRKDINEKFAKIDAKKQDIEKLQQNLSDMEDALRKAGGDPGWANK